MKQKRIVPPIKCQGIKTKLVGDIRELVGGESFDRWVEPFCGSGVVAFNLQPKQALLCDNNRHIITFYNEIKNQTITPEIAREYLIDRGENLQQKGADYYYKIRENFNQYPNSLDFLFLNRSCFNGVMRFNKKGGFNVPYCKKDQRFAKAYITKIVNQITAIAKIINENDWDFQVADFRETLASAGNRDILYLDPPYLGRHVDYYNSWSEQDEEDLISKLKSLTGKFIFSTWHSNEFRINPYLEKTWTMPKFTIHTRQHFYHVGSIENFRHPMTEALITNFSPTTEFRVQETGNRREVVTNG